MGVGTEQAQARIRELKPKLWFALNEAKAWAHQSRS